MNCNTKKYQKRIIYCYRFKKRIEIIKRFSKKINEKLYFNLLSEREL